MADRSLSSLVNNREIDALSRNVREPTAGRVVETFPRVSKSGKILAYGSVLISRSWEEVGEAACGERSSVLWLNTVRPSHRSDEWTRSWEIWKEPSRVLAIVGLAAATNTGITTGKHNRDTTGSQLSKETTSPVRVYRGELCTDMGLSEFHD